MWTEDGPAAPHGHLCFLFLELDFGINSPRLSIKAPVEITDVTVPFTVVDCETTKAELLRLLL